MLIKRILVVILVPLIGCQVRDYIRKKDRQIDYLEASNKQIETRLSKMDSLSQEQREFIVSMKAETIIKLRELENRMETVESKLGDLETLLYRKSGEPGVSSQDTSKKPENIYNVAYSDFIRGNYELAIAGFQQFLAHFKNLDNAYYWIGESYYAMGKYPEAQTAFKNVVENYPMSKNAPPSFYKLITIYNITQDTLNMQHYLEKLIERYPDSPEAKLLEKTIPPKEE